MSVMGCVYCYDGRWGENPALHTVCTFLENHQAKETTAAMELGFFLGQFADESADFVREIRGGVFLLESAKASGDNERAKQWTEWKRECKKKSPCIIPAAYYPKTHAANDECTPTNILCIDIDRQDNLQIPLNEWANLPADIMHSTMGKHCLFVGESQSGWRFGGYFCLVLLSGVDDFAARFAAVENWFSCGGVKIDAAAKNINHCRAISFQDNSERDGFCTLPQVNCAAVPFAVKWKPKPLQKKTFATNYAGKDEYSRAARACAFVHAHGVNVCDGFDDWTKLAFALASGFGARGEELFLQCASVSAKYDERENRKKYQNALNTHTGRADLASFWYLLKSAGVDIAQFGK